MHRQLEQINAVILAGGQGARIRHLLPDLPKPMAPVAGRPFLDWVVRYWAKQGIGRVVLSTGYLGEKIEAYFQSHPVEGVDLSCVRERGALGTAGGFRHAAVTSGERPEAWLVLNGDSIVLASLGEMSGWLADPGIDGVILGVAVPDAARYGLITQDGAGHLVRFEEKRPGAGIINAGVYLLRSRLIGAFPGDNPLSFENEVFPALIRREARLRVQVCHAPFLDIGTPESLPLAESFIQQNQPEFAIA